MAGIQSCKYREACTRYLATLGIKDCYRDEKYDKCFCDYCAQEGGFEYKKCSLMGHPPEKFAVPIGWMKFGIKVPPQADGLKVFENWHVCYHGTAPEKVSGIIECGGLLASGDTNVRGETVATVPGHIPDVAGIFVSPSIRYCTYNDVYAKEKIFLDRKTSKMYRATVLLQLRIKPESYHVGPQTVLDRSETSRIDPLFSNSTLEWSTEWRGATIIYGVLVLLQQV